MAGAAASVLDATFLQASLTSLRDARKGAALGTLKELDSSARAQGSSSSQLPQVITLKTGSAAADILTSDLLLCTDITGCRVQELSKDGTLTLPEEPSEALLALVQLFEGKACLCTVLGSIIRMCSYCPAEAVLNSTLPRGRKNERQISRVTELPSHQYFCSSTMDS